MKEEILKRLRSKVVWVAALAQALLIIMLVNPDIADMVKIVGGALIEIATLFGILNNPSDSENF